jgi:hypothetical protein
VIGELLLFFGASFLWIYGMRWAWRTDRMPDAAVKDLLKEVDRLLAPKGSE